MGGKLPPQQQHNISYNKHVETIVANYCNVSQIVQFFSSIGRPIGSITIDIR